MKCSRTLRRDLKFSNQDSFASSVMVGTGETFMPAFALAIGFSQVAAGMLSTAPLLMASVLQLLGPYIIARFGSYRKWITILAVAQAISFLPLIWGAVEGEIPTAVIFFAMTMYWTCGMASGPAWNAWMGHLMPAILRPRYLGKRNRYGQIGVLVGLVSAGFFLEWLKPLGLEMHAFASLFGVAFFFRLVSAYFLWNQTDVEPIERQSNVSWRELILRLLQKRDGRLILFFAFFQVAVQTSGPFVNPYLLKQLQLPYVPYMVLVASAFIAKIIIFPVLGPWAKRAGSFRLMQMGSIGAMFTPMFWMFSDNFYWLICSQFLNGLIWAVFDLGFTLALFETIKDSDRTRLMSIHNVTNAIAVMIGASIGAGILKAFGESHGGYMILFTFSIVSRMVTAFALERIVLKVGAKHLAPSYVLKSSLSLIRRDQRPPDTRSAS